jgi:CRISPR-associated endonuclease/helicase Cas3
VLNKQKYCDKVLGEMAPKVSEEALAHPGHFLQDHLRSVAQLAGEFASWFNSAEWGELAGLWHDLGKFQPSFQRKLRGEQIAVEHSGAGAAYAYLRAGDALFPLAFVIAGHHTGLANLTRSDPGGPCSLRERLANNRQLSVQLSASLPPDIATRNVPVIPPHLPSDLNRSDDSRRRLEMWIRFLFSALADADYLDTEQALDPARAARRRSGPPIGELAQRIESEITRRCETAATTPVNEARRRLAEACLVASNWYPGLFALTAPTGSGKTLSGMRFALQHARTHGLRRIIVVLPYTSIIEQNAAVYRSVLGDDAVLEHHSHLDPEKEQELQGDEVTERHRLAAENWDAPVVLTTSVQFFESLFANRPSRCRKLHRIARSVIIFDEVQSLPLHLLIPILDGLKTLAADYGCSIVLSTATPPALVAHQNAKWGLPDVKEIAPDAGSLFQVLRRVQFHWPEDESASSWEDLAERIAAHSQALTIVHLRKDARTLAERLSKADLPGTVHHLSAAMCPAHRSEVLGRVRADLAQGEPCYLVSTQLVEAGVDIDFPVLFRAMAGLDSLVQAAGRCNREGLLEKGLVYVFNACTDPPPGVLRHGIETMRNLLRSKGTQIDLSDPKTCTEYFRSLYGATVSDRDGIQAERAQFNFYGVASRFQLIEDGSTASIVVPYGERACEFGDRIRTEGPSRELYRALQPYVVRVYPEALKELLITGAIEQLQPGLYRLLPQADNLYDPRFGLSNEGMSPGLLLV